MNWIVNKAPERIYGLTYFAWVDSQFDEGPMRCIIYWISEDVWAATGKDHYFQLTEDRIIKYLVEELN